MLWSRGLLGKQCGQHSDEWPAWRETRFSLFQNSPLFVEVYYSEKLKASGELWRKEDWPEGYKFYGKFIPLVTKNMEVLLLKTKDLHLVVPPVTF